MVSPRASSDPAAPTPPTFRNSRRALFRSDIAPSIPNSARSGICALGIRHLEDHNPVLWHGSGVGPAHWAEITMVPQVAQPPGPHEADLFQVQRDVELRFAAIEQAHSLASIRERFCPDFERAFIPNAVPLNAFGVLIHRDDFRVR